MARSGRPRPWFRKGRGWYLTDNGLQRRVGDVGETLAEVLERLVAISCNQLQSVAIQSATFGDAYARFLAHYRRQEARGEVAPATVLSYRTLLKRLPRTLLEAPLASLRGADLDAWIDDLGGKPRTRHHRGRLAKQITAWAASEGLVAVDPLARWRAPRGSKLRRDWPGEESIRLVLDGMRGPARELCEFLLATGARIGEACSARSEHLRGDVIVLPQHKTARKTGKPRVILLPDPWPKVLGTPERRERGWLFLNRDGVPWIPGSVSRTLRYQAAKVGVSLSPHLLRHAFATRLLRAGVDAATVAALIGHADARVTLTVYAHVDREPDHLRAALRRAG